MNFKNKQFKCKQDPNTGILVCKSFAQNKDGTQVELASLHASVDGECHPVITDMQEYYPGEFEALEKKVTPRLIGKCQKTPSDF